MTNTEALALVAAHAAHRAESAAGSLDRLAGGLDLTSEQHADATEIANALETIGACLRELSLSVQRQAHIFDLHRIPVDLQQYANRRRN